VLSDTQIVLLVSRDGRAHPPDLVHRGILSKQGNDRKNCAQIVSKLCQGYRNVSKGNEVHRNPKVAKTGLLRWKFIVFYALDFSAASYTR